MINTADEFQRIELVLDTFDGRIVLSTGMSDETIVVEESPNDMKAGSDSLFLFSPPHPSNAAHPAHPAHAAHEDGGDKSPAASVASTASVGDHHSEACRMNVLDMAEHKEALKLQELLFQDRLLQKEREIQSKENEHQQVKAKLESLTEAQAQMRWWSHFFFGILSGFLWDA